MTIALVIGDIVVALALMAAILLQSGYTPGMSGAFGGTSMQPYSGKKKGVDEFLARVTVVLAVVFGALTLLLAHFWR